MTDRMRIAIYGVAKTGTSALHAKLYEAMPDDTESYFEPGSHHDLRIAIRRWRERLGLGRKQSLLVKFVPFHPGGKRHLDSFGQFDHSILIVRDPRDRFVSELLYRPYDSGISRDPVAANAFIARLEEKQRRPHDISLIDLQCEFFHLQGKEFSVSDWLADYIKHGVAEPLAFAAERVGLIEFRYEYLVEQRFAELGARLGLTLSGPAKVEAQYQRVERTRGYGNWRDWFTPADVALLSPLLQPYLDRYYPMADWELSPQPVIAAEHGSEYVRRLVDESRSRTGLLSLARMRRGIK